MTNYAAPRGGEKAQRERENEGGELGKKKKKQNHTRSRKWGNDGGGGRSGIKPKKPWAWIGKGLEKGVPSY